MQSAATMVIDVTPVRHPCTFVIGNSLPVTQRDATEFDRGDLDPRK
jgi:hypothetical protein